MASKKQVAANRANAQLSTGPRTPEGKAVVRLNAVSHGILSEANMLPDEDPERFNAFSEAMRDHLAPANELEALLADRIVSNVWRLRRLLQAEDWAQWQLGFLPLKYGQTEKDRENFAGYAYMREESPQVFPTFGRYEGMLERGLFRALHELQRLQAARSGQDVPPPAAVDLHLHGGE